MMGEVTRDDLAGAVEADAMMVAEATRLMKVALSLLDQACAGHTTYGCHLSMAIDTAEEHELARTLTRRGWQSCRSALKNVGSLRH